MRACLLASLAALLAAVATAGEQVNTCAPRDGMQFICGIGAVEDLAPVPGTPFLLAGGLRFSDPVPIRAIDARDGTVSIVWSSTKGARRPDATNYPDCPGPPDAARLSTTGVALQSTAGQPPLFYAVNEGDRRAMEVFEVEAGRDAAASKLPLLTWVGCIPMPAGTDPNAVTPLEGRSLAIVSMDDGAVDRMARHIAGEAMGSVWIWRARSGLRQLPALRLLGGNGIVASADHRWLYVSEWSGSRLLRIATDGSVPPQITALPFLPDNLKLSPDGSLLLAAQLPPLRRIAECTDPACPAGWTIVRIDVDGMRQTVLSGGPGDARINYATGAVEFEGRIWITNRGDGRIIRLPAPR